jgi:hypothetical protein
MARIKEEQLIVPALKVMNTSVGGTITTTDLIDELTKIMKPTGEDLDILKNRNDTKFSQKVRNLKSHNTMKDLTTYTPPPSKGESGTFTINNKGKAYLIGK